MDTISSRFCALSPFPSRPLSPILSLDVSFSRSLCLSATTCKYLVHLYDENRSVFKTRGFFLLLVVFWLLCLEASFLLPGSWFLVLGPLA